MIKINNIDDLVKNFNKLPLVIMQDIDKRIEDWICSGGKYTDPYIINQCKYAEKIINRR